MIKYRLFVYFSLAFSSIIAVGCRLAPPWDPGYEDPSFTGMLTKDCLPLASSTKSYIGPETESTLPFGLSWWEDIAFVGEKGMTIYGVSDFSDDKKIAYISSNKEWTPFKYNADEAFVAIAPYQLVEDDSSCDSAGFFIPSFQDIFYDSTANHSLPFVAYHPGGNISERIVFRPVGTILRIHVTAKADGIRYLTDLYLKLYSSDPLIHPCYVNPSNGALDWSRGEEWAIKKYGEDFSENNFIEIGCSMIKRNGPDHCDEYVYMVIPSSVRSSAKDGYYDESLDVYPPDGQFDDIVLELRCYDEKYHDNLSARISIDPIVAPCSSIVNMEVEFDFENNRTI